jgi:hypothetical protein
MIEHYARGAAAAGRAKGALILALFGSFWLAGAISIYGNMPDAERGTLAMILLAALLLSAVGLLYAWITARRLKPLAQPWTPEVRRAFWIVNGLQYAALGLIGSLFGQGAHQQWLVPLGIAVVGLHFLRLARLFGSPLHGWIGVAMLAVATLVVIARLPPFSPIGIFAAGAVLLAGAILLAGKARRMAGNLKADRRR